MGFLKTAQPEQLYGNVAKTGDNLMRVAPGYAPESQKFDPKMLADLGKAVSDYGFYQGKSLADAQSPEAAQAAKDYYQNMAIQGQIARGGVAAVPKVGNQFLTGALRRGVASGINPRSSISSARTMDDLDLQNLALMSQAAQTVSQVPQFAEGERQRYQSQVGITPGGAVQQKTATDWSNIDNYNQFLRSLQGLGQNIASQDVSAGLQAGQAAQAARQQGLQNLLGLAQAGASIAGAAAMCWVADELFGVNDPRTLAVRSLCMFHVEQLTPFGEFCRAYRAHGKRLAEEIKTNLQLREVCQKVWTALYVKTQQEN